MRNSVSFFVKMIDLIYEFQKPTRFILQPRPNIMANRDLNFAVYFFLRNFLSAPLP